MAKTKLSQEDRAITIEIGNRITERREAIGMKDCELAGLVGISETMFSLIENGRVATNCVILVKIARVLKVSLSELQPTELDKYSEIPIEAFPFLTEIKRFSAKARKDIVNGIIHTIRAIKPY